MSSRSMKVDCINHVYRSSDIKTEQEEPFKDKYDPADLSVDMSVVKRKSFPMPPIAVEEAVMCLEYIDHDCEYPASLLST